jgi:hypothetical protein
MQKNTRKTRENLCFSYHFIGKMTESLVENAIKTRENLCFSYHFIGKMRQNLGFSAILLVKWGRNLGDFGVFESKFGEIWVFLSRNLN